MTLKVAERAVDIALQSPAQGLSFEFQGGEPTLNFAALRHTVEYTESRKADREITYSVVTNLADVDDEMLAFFADRQIAISTSLDGPSDLHTRNRPWMHDGSFDSLVRNIGRARDAGCAPLGAILTTTRFSLGRAADIVETYVDLGFRSVFVRPMTPLGRAQLNWNRIGYTAQEFVDFYGQCLAHIVKLALQGVDISEVNATTLLRKITNQHTNYMELRSPCGATIGQLAYNYDGAIYPCDEARMLAEAGDHCFKLGDVFHSQLVDLIESPITKAMCIASCLESLPGCAQCVYMPYCGTCPVVSYAQAATLFPQRGPADPRCVINRGMLDLLFEYLRADDVRVTSLLTSWAS
jgi:His-Xaa-Ser system radical SAM maturase HxsB